jgi:Caspase domain
MNEFRRSIAVIFGIDNYENGIPKLRTAARDAKILGRILRRDHGYEVLVHCDQDATSAAM